MKNAKLVPVFDRLENGILVPDYVKGYATCSLSEATRHLGRPYLKTVSVGHYDADGKWVEDRKDFAWVSNDAIGYWMPAKFDGGKPRLYYKAKEVLGNDCYLYEDVEGLWWVSKGDASLKIKAKRLSISDERYDAKGARRIIGPCVLGKNAEGMHCWISKTVPSVYLLAVTPDYLIPDKNWGA